jgi:hypothetical protein
MTSRRPTAHTNKLFTTCPIPRFVALSVAYPPEPSCSRPLSSQEPKLWYGIGILYDRYGSLEHAEEAFSSVIRMDPSALSPLLLSSDSRRRPQGMMS